MAIGCFLIFLLLVFVPDGQVNIIERCAEGSYNTTAICYTNPDQTLCVDTVFMCVEGEMVDQKTFVNYVILDNN